MLEIDIKNAHHLLTSYLHNPSSPLQHKACCEYRPSVGPPSLEPIVQRDRMLLQFISEPRNEPASRDQVRSCKRSRRGLHTQLLEG